MTAARRRALLSWLLSIVAIAFVAWIVPVRDRCVDPARPAGPRVARVDTAEGCALRRDGREEPLAKAACEALSCEPGLATTLRSAQPKTLAALLLVYLGGALAWSARWRELLRPARLRPSLGNVFRVTLEAQAAGVLLPGGVGGDALRIAAMVGRGAALSTVVATVLLDRVTGLVTLAMVAGVLGLAAGGGAGGSVRSTSAVFAAFPVAFALGLWLVRRPAIATWLRQGPLARVTRTTSEYLSDAAAPAAVARAFALSLVVSLVQIAVIRGAVAALGASPVEERWVYVGAAVSFMVGALPALPGAWGTADAAFVFFLGLAGLSPQVALSVSLIYRAYWYLAAVLGAILRLSRPATPPIAAPAEPPG
jgi:uncharacterized membrane protein YbhN (UPF0104 family)